jgi:MYXO-CTERM domain-containing protein
MGVALVLSLVACDAQTARDLALGEARITHDGASIAQTRVGLARIGRASTHDVIDGAVARVGDEVHIARGAGLTEWWRSVGAGLEHGVTIEARPEGVGALVLEMATNVRATGDDIITLRDEHDTPLASYGGLSVLDANGVHVPSSMHAVDHTIRIEVDDANAIYPLVVDPWFIYYEARLDAVATTPQATTGPSIAMTADGSRAVLALYQDNNNAGGVYVFLRGGAPTAVTWTQEQALVSGPNAYLARRVAISDDGTTIVASENQSTASAIHVFTRSGTTWTEQASLHAPSTPVRQGIGLGLSISGDATRVFATNATDTHTLVWVGGGGTYTYEAALSDPTQYGGAPTIATVSSDATGTRVGVGSRGPSSFSTYATVFVRSGTTWTTEYSYGIVGAGDIVMSADGSRFATVSAVAAGTVLTVSRTGTNWVTDNGSVPTNGSWSMSGDGQQIVTVTTDTAGTMSATHYRWSDATYWTADPTTAIGGLAGLRVIGPVASTLDGYRWLFGIQSGAAGTRPYAEVFSAPAPIGAHCMSGASHCDNGLQCVEGVCCNAACGGGTPNGACQSCLAARNGGTDGYCGSLTPAYAPTVTCRASTGPCDVAAVCLTGDTTCHPNAFTTGTVCRPASGVCDIAETCSGSSAMCPTDTFAGSSVVCRPIAGVCDAQETCTGASASCPADAFLPTTTACRNASALCEAPATCTGSSADCPPLNPLRLAGTVCHTMTGVCDRTTMCDGVTNACNYYLTSVCRPAVGACDVAESCTGATSNCPPDAVEGAGTVCRASTASCDPAESCDGTSTMCMADVNTCAVQPDLGVAHDAGAAIDGGASDASASDASPTHGDASGTAPAAAAGCSCRTTRSRSNDGWLALLVLVLLARRRVA